MLGREGWVGAAAGGRGGTGRWTRRGHCRLKRPQRLRDASWGWRLHGVSGEIGVPGDSDLLRFLTAVGSPLAAVSPCAALSTHLGGIAIAETSCFALTHCVAGRGAGTHLFFI